jgi:hypothetical protein
MKAFPAIELNGKDAQPGQQSEVGMPGRVSITSGPGWGRPAAGGRQHDGNELGSLVSRTEPTIRQKNVCSKRSNLTGPMHRLPGTSGSQ